MSHVVSMIITCELVEEDEDGGLPALHEWCAAVERRPIRFGTLDDAPAVSQSKGLEVLVLAAAGNYFDHEALIKAFPTFPWLWPDSAVLVVHDEGDGPAQVVYGSPSPSPSLAAEVESLRSENARLTTAGCDHLDAPYRRLLAEVALLRSSVERVRELANGRTEERNDGDVQPVWPDEILRALDGTV